MGKGERSVSAVVGSGDKLRLQMSVSPLYQNVGGTPMQFTQFVIRNFKGISEATLNLEGAKDGGVIALVGLNESGKTSILRLSAASRWAKTAQKCFIDISLAPRM